jgi:hypothetical protein
LAISTKRILFFVWRIGGECTILQIQKKHVVLNVHYSNPFHCMRRRNCSEGFSPTNVIYNVNQQEKIQGAAMDDSSYRWNFDLNKKNEIHYHSWK